jgi:Fe-S cluster assembly protein SufD
VVLGAGAELTLVEIFRGGRRALVAPATEVRLEEGATLTHLRLLLEEPGSVHLGTLDAVLDARSCYRSQVFSLGGAAARLDLHVELRAPGGEAQLEGVALGAGTQHLEQHTRVVHAASASESHATYRAILADRSVSTFDGAIAVRREAAGTVATLENRNLLLSEDAVVHTQPRLEIDTDEVQCSHGATVGQLDPAQLFYLRSRGLGLEEARGLLTLAFVRALADRVDDPDLHALVLGALAERLPGVDATRLEGVA